MKARDPLSSFLQGSQLAETFLEIPERKLISSILREANDCGQTPESRRCLEQALARALGELILQRATEKLGAHALDAIRRQLSSGRFQDPELEPSIYAGPPTPAPSPHPPAPSPAPGPHRGVFAVDTISAGPPTPAPSPHPPAPSPAPSPHSNIRRHADISAGPPTPAPSPHPPAPSPTGPHHALQATQASRAATLPAQLILDADCILLDEFLAPAELAELTRFTLDHESDFRVSEVISPGVAGGVIDPEHRRSRVLMDIGQFERLMFQRIQAALPVVLDKLGMSGFPVTRFESQITASNDGDFFRHHSDNGDDESTTRQLTFVYFFHHEPKAFRGGELRIRDSRLENGIWQRTGDGKTVLPEQNQIVFFRSDLLHEITPVICPSQAFADSRFTVNGWLHR